MNRSVLLLVFGILNLAFAAMGLIGVAMSLAMLSLPKGPGVENMMVDVMRQNPQYMAYQQYCALPLGFLFSLLLAGAGVGLLKAKSWGRILSLIWSVCSIAMAVINGIVMYSWLFEPLMDRAAQMPEGPEKFGLMGGAIGGLVGIAFGLTYPAVLLIFMLLPAAKRAIARNPLNLESYRP
jgi:hypothetical protein